MHKYILLTQHTLCTCGVQHFNNKINVLVERQKLRRHPGLNQGPLHLQSNALPLSYIHIYHTVSKGLIKVLIWKWLRYKKLRNGLHA